MRLRRIWLTLVFAIILANMGKGMNIALAERLTLKGSQIVVVYGAKGGKVEYHAASEFANYVGKMTGTKINVIKDNEFVPGRKGVVLVGNSAANRMVYDLEKQDLVSITKKLPQTEDGFVITTASDEDKRYLILAGRGGRGTLYSVYYYLETFCKVGFFADGERIPEIGEIPFSDINIVEEPKFSYRMFRGSAGVRGVKLYQSMLWDFNDWKRHIDWGIKKGYNAMYICFNGGDIAEEEILRQAFPEVKFPEMESEKKKRCRFRMETRKKAFAYAKERGIKFLVHIGFDYSWTEAFEETFPELKEELKKAGNKRGYRYYGPDNPFRNKFNLRLWKYLLSEFGLGRNNLYFVSYASEDPNKKAFQPQAMKQAYKVLRTLDPEGRVFQDTWNFYTCNWTRDGFDAWDKFVPEEIGLMDSVGYLGGSYKRYNYFNDRKWVLEFINQLTGADQLHIEPNLKFFIKLLRNILEDPDAGNCIGTHWRPEAMRTNIFFEDFLAKLSWDPFNVEENSFIEDYVVRRYGEKSKRNMIKSLKEVLNGMVYGKITDWKVNGGGGDILAYAYILRSCDEESIRRAQVGANYWERALEYALLEKKRQKGNQLYDMYLIEVFKTYCSKVFYLPLLRLSNSYYKMARIQEFNLKPEERLNLFIYRNSFDNPYWHEPTKFARLKDAQRVQNIGFIRLDGWRLGGWGLTIAPWDKKLNKGSIIYKFNLPSPYHFEGGKLSTRLRFPTSNSKIKIAIWDGEKWKFVYDSDKDPARAGKRYLPLELPEDMAGLSSFKMKFILEGNPKDGLPPCLENISLECKAKRGIPFKEQEEGILLKKETIQGSIEEEKRVFEEEAEKIFFIFDSLDKVVSTRKEFSIANLVREVDAYPGGSPDLHRLIIETNAVSCGYWSSMISENVRWILKPMFEAVIDGVRDMIKEKKGIPHGNLYFDYPEITGKWHQPLNDKARKEIEEELRAEEGERDSTLRAVVEAYGKLKEKGCSSHSYPELINPPKRQGWFVFSNMGNLPYHAVGALDEIYQELKKYDKGLLYGFDFGIGNKVREDYIRILPTTVYSTDSGYGWNETAGLDSWDESYPDDLNGDYIFSSSNKTFNIDLPPQKYRVIIFLRNFDFEIGNLQCPNHWRKGKVDIWVEGSHRESHETSPAETKVVSFPVKLSDGQLNVELRSRTSKPWVISGMIIQKGGR